MNEHKFNYRWTLADANFTKDKGKVFSCFACGGGSTMGYKLAGFDVIGCNEIDKRMNDVYIANHHPKYNYLCDIRELVKKAKAHELPEELYNLDVLDGSPPCTSFSMAGNREKDWGKKKHFREGQTTQVLDTLFFDFIELANELQPKCVIGENVSGMLKGNAIKYVANIRKEFEKAGYSLFLQLVDGSKMGVPQKRQRVFFVAVRNDLKHFCQTDGMFGDIYFDFNFNEKPILYGEFADDDTEFKLYKSYYDCWLKRIKIDDDLGSVTERIYNKRKFFNVILNKKNKVLSTIPAKIDASAVFHKPSFLSRNEVLLGSTFPTDFNLLNQIPHYICGMSVPPVMMAQIATRVYEQFLIKLKK